ncbi:uncharacterized protein B0H18DRAFT_1118156 [Fomitopsis serialis]|uniref:uncharacterized protein n=1 Tax=Fomitopsis serialis TaxID=139415 RepID=UPI002007309D|nr:uncharacterized protein B0H18DRAFT_1118156 [Neoantrodia serialis]KAH9928137.1 hypothetical protein B0H18DRAFT_1118156 [Neoantrodia serialis]
MAFIVSAAASLYKLIALLTPVKLVIVGLKPSSGHGPDVIARTTTSRLRRASKMLLPGAQALYLGSAQQPSGPARLPSPSRIDSFRRFLHQRGHTSAVQCVPAITASTNSRKSNIVDDTVAPPLTTPPEWSAPEGTKAAKGDYPDRIVVIMNVPVVGDAKGTIDEYCPRPSAAGAPS